MITAVRDRERSQLLTMPINSSCDVQHVPQNGSDNFGQTLSVFSGGFHCCDQQVTFCFLPCLVHTVLYLLCTGQWPCAHTCLQASYHFCMSHPLFFAQICAKCPLPCAQILNSTSFLVRAFRKHSPFVCLLVLIITPFNSTNLFSVGNPSQRSASVLLSKIYRSSQPCLELGKRYSCVFVSDSVIQSNSAGHMSRFRSRGSSELFVIRNLTTTHHPWRRHYCARV